MPIESLIDLPLMTDLEMRAAMRVLGFLTGPALYTDINLYHLHFCKMVNLSLKYGISDAAAFGYAGFGVILCLPFQRYIEGYSFGKLACDLVEKHGFSAYKARVYLSMEMVALWTHPIEVGIELTRAAFRAGAESGDLAFACYSCMHLITNLVSRERTSTPCGENPRPAWISSAKGNTSMLLTSSSASNNSSATYEDRRRLFPLSATRNLTKKTLNLH